MKICLQQQRLPARQVAADSDWIVLNVHYRKLVCNWLGNKMEYIFDCFFENTFDKITRNGLQDRSSRRDVLDHLNAVIGGCSDGKPTIQNCLWIVITVICDTHRAKYAHGGSCAIRSVVRSALSSGEKERKWRCE